MELIIMPDLFFIVAVVYTGACIGIYMNLREYKIPTPKLLLLAILSPVPIAVVLISAAIITSRDKRFAKNTKDKFFLCFLCLLMYADAVGALGEVLVEKDIYEKKNRRYAPVRAYPIQVRQKISRAMIAI